MKILIVSAGFYPQNTPRAIRTSELAKEFARQDHEVVVYIPFKGFDYSDYAIENNITFRNLGALRLKEIKLKGRKVEFFLRRGIKRIMGLLFEYPNIELTLRVSNCLKDESDYDLLISIAVPYPIHWGVAKARTKKHQIAKIWIADCGDPYMGNRTDSYRRPFYFKYIEKWFSRKCDFISVPFDALKDMFYPEFLEKMVVIPQGYKLEDIELAKEVNNSIPTFAFAGSIIKGTRDLDLFFEALKGFASEFKFIVYTRQQDYFMKYKIYFGDRLEIHEYLPRLKLLYELSKCDFLINVDTIFDGQKLTVAFPSKLIDYSFTQRPILNICSSLIDRETIRDFLSGNYSNRRRINHENYRIEKIVQQFMSIAQF